MNRRFVSALAAYLIVILVAGLEAQSPAFVSTGAVSSPDGVLAAAPTSVHLLVGRSTILDIGANIARVSLTVPEVADAMVTSPSQLLIHGKQPGTISMFVWDKMGTIKTYEVVVRRDLSSLVEQVKTLFPGEPITIAGSGRDVIISGTVSSKYVIDKAADVAGGYVEKKENVVNLLKQAEGVASNQVMLKVRFAEVSRNALQEIGASMFSDNRDGRWFGRTTTQQFAAPIFDKNQPSAALGDTMVFSDYLNLFLFDAKNKVGAVVKALQGAGVFQSLAEPNLIALNGKEASFLAGGEFPYPVPTGNFGSFTIHFKEFGVRLTFTPTVLGGDLINLKLKPEVSSLDFNNAIILEGFRVPALTSRRAETEIELRDGQTFAIAGLMNNTALSSMRKVPFLGDIPVLGQLFRSRAYEKDQTELVVMVTPTIVRRDSTGVSEGLPSLVEPYIGPNPKPLPNPAPYVGSPYERPKSGGGSQPEPQPQPKSTAATQQLPAAQQAPATKQMTVPEPVASRPIQAPASVPTATPAEPKVDKKQVEADKKQVEAQMKAAEAAEKQRVADEKRKAEEEKAEAKVAAKKEAEQKKLTEKIEKERAKAQAEADRRAAEEAKKKQEDDLKRDKALADAAARLKAAQSAYQAEIAKKGGQQ
jgi:pilus assembly protein CpaC